MRKLKTKQLWLFALMLVMGVFLFGATAAYAASEAESGGSLVSELIEAAAENLSVDDVWLAGDILRIAVTDKNTGVNQTLELNLRDYAGIGDEYVTVQAVDRAGNISNSIKFKNPYYTPSAAPGQAASATDATGEPEQSESAIPNGNPDDGTRPFSPDGTGTVVDNVHDGDGKEFFSIETEDGNIFYLIVDRQRTVDNVYLLNAVTEQDLMSLAKSGDGTVSAVPEPPTPAAPEPPASAEPIPAAPESSGGGNGSLIFIIIAAIAVGGAGYYFKIVRPKQNGDVADDDYDDEPEDFDDDTEVDMESDEERGDDE